MREPNKYKTGEKVLVPTGYGKSVGTVQDVWWDGAQWRYEVNTRKGLWIFTENSVQEKK